MFGVGCWMFGAGCLVLDVWCWMFGVWCVILDVRGSKFKSIYF